MSIFLSLVGPLAGLAVPMAGSGLDPVTDSAQETPDAVDVIPDDAAKDGLGADGGEGDDLAKLLDIDFAVADAGDGSETIVLRYKGSREFLRHGDNRGQTLELRYSGAWALDELNNPENLLESSLAYKWDVRSKESAVRNVPASGVNWWGHLDANIGLDANQDFSERQYHFGIEAEFSLQADRSTQPHYWWIADYPAAALRALSGASKEGAFIPSYLPRVKLGIEQVMPDGDDPRAMVGDGSDFTRAYGEVNYRPLAFSTSENQWTIDVSYRHFHELGASGSVEAAGLDDFGFLKIDLFAATDGPGFFLRFVDGQLPFDVEDGQSIQVGWSTNLGE